MATTAQAATPMVEALTACIRFRSGRTSAANTTKPTAPNIMPRPASDASRSPLSAMVTMRLARAIDGAAEDNPANHLGRNALPRRAKATTKVPPTAALITTTAASGMRNRCPRLGAVAQSRRRVRLALGGGCLAALAPGRPLLRSRAALLRVRARARLLATAARRFGAVGDASRSRLRHALVLERLVLLLVLHVGPLGRHCRSSLSVYDVRNDSRPPSPPISMPFRGSGGDDGDPPEDDELWAGGVVCADRPAGGRQHGQSGVHDLEVGCRSAVWGQRSRPPDENPSALGSLDRRPPHGAAAGQMDDDELTHMDLDRGPFVGWGEDDGATCRWRRRPGTCGAR